MLGLAEIRVSAAAHLLSNEARSWTAAHSARRRTAPKGNEADGSAARFRAEGELAVNRRRVFKELPNLEVALLKKKDKKKKTEVDATPTTICHRPSEANDTDASLASSG